MRRRRRIEARVSDELADLADRLARERNLVGPAGEPNVSQLIRVLLIEERDRTQQAQAREEP